MSDISSEQLLSILNWRYATKVFDSGKKISASDFDCLKEAMRLAPSSFGLQPWHFISITDEALRAELLPHSWGQAQVTDSSHLMVLCTRTDIGVPFVEEFIASTASQRSVSLESLQPYQDVVVDFITRMTPEERVQWSKLQTYLALQRLMDSAAILSIDTCPIEGFIPTEYNRILKLPEQNLTATVCCALGYRSGADKYATLPKSRFPIEKVFSDI